MANELVVGEPRLGWFIDGDDNTPEIAVMLRDTGTAIELTIPLKGMFGRDDHYGRWWATGVKFGDDPDRVRRSYSPPRVLLFHGKQGTVALVGCRVAGSSSNARVGQGTIHANYAVLGGRNLKYEKVNAMRSEVPALAAWTRLSSMELEVERSTKGLTQSVQMTLTNAEPVSLAKSMNLEMRSTWRTEREEGEFRAFEGVKLETNVRNARPWGDHLAVHGAALDLVSIAAWKAFGFSSIEVQRHDDPERAYGGNVVAERWSPVVTHRLPKHESWSKSPRFLFPYDEIGAKGMSRWLLLRKVYERALGPMLGILRSDDRWGHSSVVQSGIALEALGYLIDKKKNGGVHLKGKNQRMHYKQGLRVIIVDMSVKPFEDLEGWVTRADAAYMGLKHLDRPELDSLDGLNTLRESLLILRFWVALQLGAKPKSLLEGLRTDPLNNEFIMID